MPFANRFYPPPVVPLSDMLDVTGPGYGAPGDGGDDDDAILNAVLADASNISAPKSVYIPQGTWKISTNKLIQHCHVIASPGAVFKHGSKDLTMFSFGRQSSWEGGIFDLTGADFDGIAFLIDGQYFTDSPFTGYTYLTPRISKVEAFAYRKLAGSGTFLKLDTKTAGILNNCFVNDIRAAWFAQGVWLYTAGTGYANANNFKGITAFQCVDGVLLEATGTYRADANTFYGLHFQTGALPATAYAIRSIGCRYNVFEGADLMDGSVLSFDTTSHYNTVITAAISGTSVIDNGIGNLVTQYSNKLWNGVDSFGYTWNTWAPNGGSALTDTNDTISGNIMFTGAEVGDFILGAAPYDLVDCLYQARVASANVVTQQIWNESAASATFASGNFNLLRIPKRKAHHFETYDFAEVAAGGLQARDFTVLGAALGDFVLCSSSTNLGNLYCSATVTAADTVTVVLQNYKSVPINPASATWYFLIIPKSRANYVHSVADLASIANGSFLTTTISMPEVALGDFVLGSIDVDITDMLLCAYGYTDNVDIVLQNSTGGAIDKAAVKFRVLHFKHTDMINL